jgi:hypothetical protein
MRTAAVVGLLAATLVLPPAATAEILVSAPARKVCVGGDGAGINLSVLLNRGWRHGPRLWFRVRLQNPAGRLVYSFRDRIDTAAAARGFEAMSYTPRRTGVFTTTFEAYGWRPTTFRTRVYRCA